MTCRVSWRRWWLAPWMGRDSLDVRASGESPPEWSSGVARCRHGNPRWFRSALASFWRTRPHPSRLGILNNAGIFTASCGQDCRGGRVVETCSHESWAPVQGLEDLPEWQGKAGRHRCATCDYSRGFSEQTHNKIGTPDLLACKHGRKAPRALIAALPVVQAGRARHKCVVCAYDRGLEDRSRLFPDQVDQPADTFREGAITSVWVNSYERNPEARRRCIESYGLKCSVCEMLFAEVYGEVGAGFIHVHHLTPLSRLGPGVNVDPIRALRPVCANCHGMLHRSDPPHGIDCFVSGFAAGGLNARPELRREACRLVGHCPSVLP